MLFIHNDVVRENLSVAECVPVLEAAFRKIETGEAMEELSPAGKVYVHGEIWNARCPDGAGKGDSVRVLSAEGMVITVQKVEEGG